MSSGPGFIIIGAMKCATSTLHEQLARQPGVFMTEPKEPNFFSDDEQWTRGPEWYRSLFEGAGNGELCGESSTHYTKQPTHPETVQRMQDALGDDLKFIYVMRHPIDRLVSHYIHEWTQRVISEPIDKAIDAHEELVDYGRYAMQLEPYIEVFGRDRILPVFFDRLTAEPASELARVCRFIGLPGEPQWIDDADRQNSSAQRMRRSGIQQFLMNCPGSRTLRRRLVPQSIRDKVKRIWMMKKRPELSAGRRAELEETFDADLAELGRWFGLRLRCKNFKQIGASTAPQWVEQAKENAA